MARILWACWDGGGNLPPSLGIARELQARGHAVAFHGRPDMVDRAKAAGLEASAFASARDDLERYSFLPMPTVFGFTGSPAVGRELVELAHAEKPDVLVVDAMFATALDVAPQIDAPSVVMVHTFANRLRDGWHKGFAMQSDARLRAGFDPLPGLGVLWGGRDLVHVNTLAALDGPAPDGDVEVHHGAPVLSSESRATAVGLPWPDDDPVPLVLLSFSTVPEQRDVDALQTALDALAPLDVHVVATTGQVVGADELAVPANAYVVPFADHEELLRRASLVVGHGGHGTTMRTLRAGVPMVVMPATGADQAGMAAFVTSYGAGLGLERGSGAEAIRSAAAEVLGDARYGTRAAEASSLFVGLDGAALGADAVESVLA
jgi:UDP:flavonoid glycosyltransferase YjiC (YdhE family)